MILDLPDICPLLEPNETSLFLLNSLKHVTSDLQFCCSRSRNSILLSVCYKQVYFPILCATAMTDGDEDVRAMHQRDLKDFLINLGILDRINNQEYKCVCCHNVITVEHVGTISKLEGKIVICCDKPICLAKFLSAEGEED